MPDAAGALRALLRADLKAAMLGKDRAGAALVRTLIAAIDNAEAVAQPDGAKPADSASFASGGAEAPRKVLTAADLAAILQNESDARLSAAAQIRSGGNDTEAERLEAEAATTKRYLTLLAG